MFGIVSEKLLMFFVSSKEDEDLNTYSFSSKKYRLMMNMLKKFEKSGWDNILCGFLLVVTVFCVGMLTGIAYLNMDNPVFIKEIIVGKFIWVFYAAAISAWLVFLINGVMLAVLEKKGPRLIALYSMFCIAVLVWVTLWFSDKF